MALQGRARTVPYFPVGLPIRELPLRLRPATLAFRGPLSLSARQAPRGGTSSLLLHGQASDLRHAPRRPAKHRRARCLSYDHCHLRAEMTGVTNNVPNSHAQDALIPDTSVSFADQCARLDDRITAFLREDNEANPRLRAVQEQTRIALGVIEEALQRYRYVRPCPAISGLPPRQLSV